MPYFRMITEQDIAYPYTDTQLRRSNRNVSLPSLLTDSVRAMFNMFPAEILDEPEYNKATHKVVQNTTPTFDEATGVWSIGWTIVEMTEEEITANDQLWSTKQRGIRNSLLQESDWVVIKATEQGQQVSSDWLNYRENLRTVPDQAGFPHNIDWPTKPL